MMAAKGIYYDPTFVRYTEPYMDDFGCQEYRRQIQNHPAAATKGIKIMVGGGPDGSTNPHGTRATEFEWLVKRADLTPARAIQAGTKTNAEAMGWQDRVGSIERGKYADLIAVTGNSLVDITELQRVRFVMKGDKIIKHD
jgi:imidazolonepropionase-like amidohydrolase